MKILKNQNNDLRSNNYTSRLTDGTSLHSHANDYNSSSEYIDDYIQNVSPYIGGVDQRVIMFKNVDLAYLTHDALVFDGSKFHLLGERMLDVGGDNVVFRPNKFFANISPSDVYLNDEANEYSLQYNFPDPEESQDSFGSVTGNGSNCIVTFMEAIIMQLINHYKRSDENWYYNWKNMTDLLPYNKFNGSNKLLCSKEGIVWLYLTMLQKFYDHIKYSTDSHEINELSLWVRELSSITIKGESHNLDSSSRAWSFKTIILYSLPFLMWAFGGIAGFAFRYQIYTLDRWEPEDYTFHQGFVIKDEKKFLNFVQEFIDTRSGTSDNLVTFKQKKSNTLDHSNYKTIDRLTTRGKDRYVELMRGINKAASNGQSPAIYYRIPSNKLKAVTSTTESLSVYITYNSRSSKCEVPAGYRSNVELFSYNDGQYTQIGYIYGIVLIQAGYNNFNYSESGGNYYIVTSVSNGYSLGIQNSYYDAWVSKLKPINLTTDRSSTQYYNRNRHIVGHYFSSIKGYIGVGVDNVKHYFVLLTTRDMSKSNANSIVKMKLFEVTQSQYEVIFDTTNVNVMSNDEITNTAFTDFRAGVAAGTETFINEIDLGQAYCPMGGSGNVEWTEDMQSRLNTIFYDGEIGNIASGSSRWYYSSNSYLFESSAFTGSGQVCFYSSNLQMMPVVSLLSRELAHINLGLKLTTKTLVHNPNYLDLNPIPDETVVFSGYLAPLGSENYSPDLVDINIYNEFSYNRVTSNSTEESNVFYMSYVNDEYYEPIENLAKWSSPIGLYINIVDPWSNPNFNLTMSCNQPITTAECRMYYNTAKLTSMVEVELQDDSLEFDIIGLNNSVRDLGWEDFPSWNEIKIQLYYEVMRRSKLLPYLVEPFIDNMDDLSVYQVTKELQTVTTELNQNVSGILGKIDGFMVSLSNRLNIPVNDNDSVTYIDDLDEVVTVPYADFKSTFSDAESTPNFIASSAINDGDFADLSDVHFDENIYPDASSLDMHTLISRAMLEEDDDSDIALINDYSNRLSSAADELLAQDAVNKILDSFDEYVSNSQSVKYDDNGNVIEQNIDVTQAYSYLDSMADSMNKAIDKSFSDDAYTFIKDRSSSIKSIISERITSIKGLVTNSSVLTGVGSVIANFLNKSYTGIQSAFSSLGELLGITGTRESDNWAKGDYTSTSNISLVLNLTYNITKVTSLIPALLALINKGVNALVNIPKKMFKVVFEDGVSYSYNAGGFETLDMRFLSKDYESLEALRGSFPGIAARIDVLDEQFSTVQYTISMQVHNTFIFIERFKSSDRILITINPVLLEVSNEGNDYTLLYNIADAYVRSIKYYNEDIERWNEVAPQLQGAFKAFRIDPDSHSANTLSVIHSEFRYVKLPEEDIQTVVSRFMSKTYTCPAEEAANALQNWGIVAMGGGVALTACSGGSAWIPGLVTAGVGALSWVAGKIVQTTVRDYDFNTMHEKLLNDATEANSRISTYALRLMTQMFPGNILNFDLVALDICYLGGLVHHGEGEVDSNGCYVHEAYFAGSPRFRYSLLTDAERLIRTLVVGGALSIIAIKAITLVTQAIVRAVKYNKYVACNVKMWEESNPDPDTYPDTKAGQQAYAKDRENYHKTMIKTQKKIFKLDGTKSSWFGSVAAEVQDTASNGFAGFVSMTNTELDDNLTTNTNTILADTSSISSKSDNIQRDTAGISAGTAALTAAVINEDDTSKLDSILEQLSHIDVSGIDTANTKLNVILGILGAEGVIQVALLALQAAMTKVKKQVTPANSNDGDTGQTLADMVEQSASDGILDR